MTVFLTDSFFDTFLNRKAKVIDCRNPDVSDIQKLKTWILCKYLVTEINGRADRV